MGKTGKQVISIVSAHLCARCLHLTTPTSNFSTQLLTLVHLLPTLVHLLSTLAYLLPPYFLPTMETEKIRYDRLNQVVKKAVEQTVKKLLMPEQLEKCFPTIAKMEGGPEALEMARKQIQKYFHSTCFKQFEHIFENRDIHNKLDQLDEIIAEAQRAKSLDSANSRVAVDKLTATQLIEATVALTRRDSIKKLTMIYDQLVLDNKQLFEELRNLATELDAVKQDIESSIAVLLSGIDEMKLLSLDLQMDVLMQQVLD